MKRYYHASHHREHDNIIDNNTEIASSSEVFEFNLLEMGKELYRLSLQFQVKLHLVRQVRRDGFSFPALQNIFDLTLAPAQLEVGVLGHVEDDEGAKHSNSRSNGS